MSYTTNGTEDGATTRSLTDLFSRPTPVKEESEASETSFLVPLNGFSGGDGPSERANKKTTTLAETCKVNLGISTWIGSFTALLYHTVFCLAHSAALVRPHSDHSSMGVLAQMTALGVCTAGASFVYQIGPYVPASYPSSDLFLAPFLAVMAKEVDSVLASQDLQNDDAVFFATFGALVATAMFLGGIVSVLAARIKLANLGNFLPYQVLTGFFSTVGVLIWMLGFSVDSNGIPIAQVLTSGDWSLIRTCFLHHLPSLVVGILMHVTSRRHPFFVMFWLCACVVMFYLVLAIAGISRQSAQDDKWFFSSADLKGTKDASNVYGPPWPFGIWWTIWKGNVHWKAYLGALRTVFALVFLYLLRCSLHSAALKKVSMAL